MRFRRNNRGALEGLPLYLIILVVIAAIVIVIILGWLSTLNKAELGSVTFTVAGTKSTIDSSDTTVTQNAPSIGECIVQVSPPAGDTALTVNTYDTHSNPLSGVVVAVTAGSSGILNLNVTPASQETTGSSGFATGQVQFAGIIFDLAPDTSTGIINIGVTYSGGIAQNTGGQTISVSAPNTC